MDAGSGKICGNCGTRNENNAARCKKCKIILKNKEPVEPLGEITVPPVPNILKNKEPVGASLKEENNSTIIPPVPLDPPSRYNWRTRRRLFLVLVFVLLLLTLGGFFLFHPGTTPGPTGISRDGIGVTETRDGEYIGLSDGSYALDTNRPDGKLKEAAAASLQAGNTGQAIAQWDAALQIDTNDAEALIYLEDQRVLASGDPYITIVVGALLNSGDAYSRDILQGAYVRQEECDAALNPCGVKIRLLIAKSGKDATHSKDIATQIVQAAHFDKTIVGVLGWPTTISSLDAVQVLAQAHIPMISATSAGDNLTVISN